MKNKFYVSCNMLFKIFLILILTYNKSYCWGFFAHRKINKHAIFSLPPKMFGFYKYYADYIEESAVNPDKRRYVIEGEACKHYIDIEAFIKRESNFKNKETGVKDLPKDWRSVSLSYSNDFLQLHGTLPWTIINEKHKLTQAFKNKDLNKILKLSADIGHYIADANVPLHTSENYDGQLTNQKGIHAFWETRIPELFFDRYELIIGKAEYINNIKKVIWNAIYNSHLLVNELLNKDKELTKTFPANNKYSLEEKNGIIKKVISIEYCQKYIELIHNQVEIQFRKSIKMVSDFWMTCWIDAGKPELDDLLNKVPKKNIDKNSKLKIKEIAKIRNHE
ncbi:MAG: S1/P1 Nuclease [Bacteroidetes bacterium]|nr:S1/P1 Nuclease [Bacteroidota bacterium]